MARLSVEHYRANANMTPEHVRKSSRFRDMFKSRSMSSNSLIDPSTRSPPAKSPLSPPVSPTSPTVKPGFEQVGLLPSEQGSIMDVKSALEDNECSHVAEVLVKQVQELKDVSVPHNVNTKLEAAGAGHVDDAARVAMEKKCSQEVNEMAEAFKDALSQRDDEAGDRRADITIAETSAIRVPPLETQSRFLRHSKSRQELRVARSEDSSTAAHADHSDFDDSEATNESTAQKLARVKFAKVVDVNGLHEAHHANKGFEDADDMDQDFTIFSKFGESKKGCNEPESMFRFEVPAPGTFYNAGDDTTDGCDEHNLDDLRANGRRSRYSHHINAEEGDARVDCALVTKMITEALAKHDRKPLQISFHVDLTKPVGSTKATDSALQVPCVKLFGCPKSFAIVDISDPPLAFVMQFLVVLYYTWVILRVFFYGAANEFLNILGSSICLAAYAIGKARFGTIVQGEDILLAPVEYVKDILVEIYGQATRKITREGLKMMVEALRDMADEIKVEVKME